jgi:hypothetical protein
MAIYHCTAQVISRSSGRSAIAAAAYRARDKLHDEKSGTTHDYRKKGGLSHEEILIPDHAAPWLANREKLWSEVEKSESRVNSQLAREFILALPVELTLKQNIQLTRDFAKSAFVNRGMIADVCIHDIGAKNPHAHIMLTMRHATRDGLAKEKKSAREWNDKEVLKEQRAEWSAQVNKALEQARINKRVDHRSWKNRGIDHTPQIHLGWYAHQQQQRGIITEKGDEHRRITEINQLKDELTTLEEQQRRIQTEIEKTILKKPVPPQEKRTPKSPPPYQYKPPEPPDQKKKLLEHLLQQQKDRERSKPRSEEQPPSAIPSRGNINHNLAKLTEAISEFEAAVEKLKSAQHQPKPDIPPRRPHQIREKDDRERGWDIER